MKNLRRFLISLLAVISLQVVAQAMTWSDIKTNTRLAIKDTNTTRQRYSDTQLLSLANECQRDLQNAGWIVSKSTSFPLVSGTTYYNVPTDVVAITRVTHGYKLLKETTMDAEDAASSGWELAGGPLPRAYFQDRTQPGKIGFVPWPNAASSTSTVRMQYVAQPADMASTSDTPLNADARYAPYHDLFIQYIAYRVYLLEGETAKADYYGRQYESRLQNMRDRLGSKPNYNPGFSSDRGK
jgi:hypothetical protein